MPRKKRIHYRNAFYHVMMRGNYKQNIFLNNKDRNCFLNILEDTIDKYCYNLHLFCLMDNHVHLVIEVHDIPLAKIMQSINTRYSKAHNHRHNKIGHLFQGRYHAKLIQNDEYFLELCYYIHMNPIKAGICSSLEGFLWSSHPSYINSKYRSWLNTQHIKSLLLKRIKANDNHYLEFMLNRTDKFEKPEYCKIDDSGLLVITDSVNKKMQGTPAPELVNMSIHEIIEIISEQLKINPKEIISGSQAVKPTLGRSLVTYFCHYHAKYTLQDISLILYRDPSSLSKTLQRHLKMAKEDAFIRSTMILVEKALILYRPEKT